MSTESASRHRKDAASVILAAVVSLLLAGLIGGGAIFWKQLDDSKKNQNALANQVKALGGTPVVEPGKPGSPGDPGPPGPQGRQGVQGPQGPPGIAGRPGPIGITGQSPRCLLEPTRCVGPAGKNGTDGQPGTDGVDGVAGKQGPPGIQGPDPTAAQIAAAVSDYCAQTSKPCKGADSTVQGPPGPDSSAAKCAEMNGTLRELTVTTTDPVTQAKVLVCVLPQ